VRHAPAKTSFRQPRTRQSRPSQLPLPTSGNSDGYSEMHLSASCPSLRRYRRSVCFHVQNRQRITFVFCTKRSPIKMRHSIFALALIALSATAPAQSFLSQYKGEPFHDSAYHNGPQKIPGRVLCAYYDLGGEGVAYHDADPVNHGSGELNPADGTYLNEFRIHEGVDTSYTKFDRKPDQIDDNPYNKVIPPRDLVYVGWTEPGEWFNITVDAAQAGTYAADFLYTSNRGGTISIDVNGKEATGPL